MEVAQSGKDLREKTIFSFIQQIEKLKYLPLDSLSFSNVNKMFIVKKIFLDFTSKWN